MKTIKEKNDLACCDKHASAVMIDVTSKAITERSAIATGVVLMQLDTLYRIMNRTIIKGDVLAIASLAGIMAAKRAADLIPLCHPLSLTSVTVDLVCSIDRSAVDITATIRLLGQTGVEMEALTAVSVAALTVYDMCKANDRGIQLTNIRLLSKSGGKSGIYKGI